MSLEDGLYKFLKFYKKFPLPVKSFLGVLYRNIPNRIKYGAFYFKYTQRINREKKEEYLKRHLELISSEVPFYKAINSRNILNYPIINKSIVKERFNDFQSLTNKKRILANTGGSSGTPFEFYLEKSVSRPKEKAHFDWYWKKFGYKSGDKILMIRGEALSNNKLFEFQTIENKLAVSCYLINSDNIACVIKEINRFKPSFIHAYPSALKNFIDNVNEINGVLKTSIKTIFLGSEGLIESDRNKIKSFFNANICHWYGHSERLIHAGNCPYSDEFHIFDFYGYAELVDDNDKLINEHGIKGRIIATGYDNRVMPLVRYDTGDEAEYSEKLECKCGFKGRSFKKIHGRRQDYIFLNDKTKVSLTAFIFGQHFEEFALIKEIQLEQTEYGKLIVRVIANQEDFDKPLFVNKLVKSVESKLEVQLIFVDQIPKTGRGKQIFLIQKIKNV